MGSYAKITTSSFLCSNKQPNFYSVQYYCRCQSCHLDMTTSPAIQLTDTDPHTKTNLLLSSVCFHRKAWMCWFGLFMWRPVGWLSSKSECSVLFIMPAPSLARPLNVWYCFTTGKMFCQRLWVPEPSWNTRRMSRYVWDSCVSLYSQKYWSLILLLLLHSIPAILIVHFGFPSHYDCLLQQTITAVSCPETCQQMAPIHHTALHTSVGFGYNPGINQNCGPVETKTKQCFMYVQTTVALHGQLFRLCDHLPPLFPSSSLSKIGRTETKQCRGKLFLHQM